MLVGIRKGPQMSPPRILFLVLGLLMLLPLPLCAFGFLASFEYPGVTGWHIAYGSGAILLVLLSGLFLFLGIKGARGDRQNQP